MALIKGMNIIYFKKNQIGTDGFNRPIYEYIEEIVENVLVSPLTTDEVLSSIDLTGKKIAYNLGIPKGDTHDWKDATVKFFGAKWKTVGYPIEGIEENIPLDWHKKVMVERYE